jgi:UDP-N-acetylmuramate dehydrogenase
MNRFDAELCRTFGSERIKRDVPLASLTTFRVGGPADWLLETKSADEIVAALRLAHQQGIPVTMLGGGSNVLVSDAGVRGLVVRPRGGEINSVDPTHVRADAAVTLNGLVRWTITRSLAGLETWAGTPGTVGGAIFGNAHFRGRNIGDLVTAVRIASRSGEVQDVAASEVDFGYDRSRLQTTGEVLLAAVFLVAGGEASALRVQARESLAYRKRTQPLNQPSAGCVFQNPDPSRDRVPDPIPWSAGALIDRAGLKGLAIGGARVSPTHANFIVNDGSATARDIRRVIVTCRTRVRAALGVELRDEIVYLGDFDVDTVD